MTLAPLLTAPPVIQLHAFAALGALLLGGVQLLAPKGRGRHRIMGWTWVVLMAVVALSSFWIATKGHLSWIHLISGWVVVLLPIAVLSARRGRIRAHHRAMASLYLGGLIIAGGFTLLPGRIMGAVVFGW
ncbi:DUF2306 domain-containing protein [Falsiroseomonas sp.]|uniref:DUF2306 domain-containing protein n=1 Tax=Falsiroseomonas sp. TaxID=2870721 RepID=UPI003F7110E9